MLPATAPSDDILVLRRPQIYLAAGLTRVPLKENSAQVLQASVAAGTPTHIASVNWSSDLIWGALQTALLAEPLTVHSNSLEVESGFTTGKIAKYVPTGPECMAKHEASKIQSSSSSMT